MDAEPNQQPAHGWTCFHCGETFTQRECAAVHFGFDEIETPACLLAAQDGGLVEIIRKQETELDRFRREDTPSYREFYALGAEHSQAVRRSEEEGYARGLKDAATEIAFAGTARPLLERLIQAVHVWRRDSLAVPHNFAAVAIRVADEASALLAGRG